MKNSNIWNYAYFCIIMRIDIITVLPELLESPFSHSIVRRARAGSLVQIVIHDLKAYGKGKYRQTDRLCLRWRCRDGHDDRTGLQTFGRSVKERSYDEILYTSPDGEPFSQKEANRLSCLQNIIILADITKGSIKGYGTI